MKFKFALILIFVYLLRLTAFAQNINIQEFYTIKSIQSGHYISIGANAMFSGAGAIQWSLPANASEDGQAYRFIKSGEYYVIEVRNKNGLCLGLNNTAQGSQVVMLTNDASDKILWKIRMSGSSYCFQNKANNQLLNVSGASMDRGAAIICWPESGASNEKWILTPAKEESPYWENLGNAINSKRSETSPCFSADGKTMYFSIGDQVNGMIANGDIYVATLDEKGHWGDAKEVRELNNTAYNGVLGCFPGNNKLLLFGGYDGKTALLSITQRTATGWGKPEALDIKTPELSQYTWSATIGSDGRTIIIELNTTGRQNESDMYVTFQNNKGEWSKLLSMGPVLNKAYAWDGTPYLSPDMKTLYFNSNRNNKYGTDFYMSKRLDDTWTNWSEPVKQEVSMYEGSIVQYYAVPGNGEYAYFVSGHKSFGEGDIFRMKIKTENKPEPFLIINGRTLDKNTNQPVSAEIIFEDLSTSQIAGKVTSNPVTGAFQIALPKGKNYGIYCKATGYYALTENMDLTNFSAYDEAHKDLFLVLVEKGKVINLNNIFFVRSKAELLPESYPELERLAKLLKENPSIRIEIRGHTDNQGDPKLNQTLSEQRVATVTNYLIKAGIDKNRLQGKGFGGTSPIAPNNTEENRQKNRRVEFVVLEK